MNLFRTAFFLGLLTGMVMLIGWFVAGRGGMLVALVVAAAMNFVSYWFSDKIVLASYRATPVTPEQAPRLHAAVDRLCAKMGVPKPAVYILPEPSPNAFATGRSPSHAAIAATQGLLELMNDDELDGVLAHELSHVHNRDILIASMAATIAGAVMMMASMARWGALAGGGGRNGRGGNPIALLLTAILAPVAATLIQLAVSRSREYAADASGAHAVGHSEGLASALEKLGRVTGRIPMDASPATSHLFIVRPQGGFSLGGLFSTHPPLEERIRRLRAMR